MQNTFSVVGRVVGEPEERLTPTGKKVMLFSVAENVRINGEQRDPYYWNVELWEKQAEFWKPIVKKGQILLLIGSLKQSVFTPEGSSYKVTNVIVSPRDVLAFDNFVSPRLHGETVSA